MLLAWKVHVLETHLHCGFLLSPLVLCLRNYLFATRGTPSRTRTKSPVKRHIHCPRNKLIVACFWCYLYVCVRNQSLLRSSQNTTPVW